jgi:hypothetical protein
MSQFSFPTDPHDPNWPWPGPILAGNPSPTIPFQIVTNGSFYMPIGDTIWCFDPRTNHGSFIPARGLPTATGFKKLDTSAKHSDGKGEASIKYSSNDGHSQRGA